MRRLASLCLLVLLLPGRLSAEQAILSPQDIFHPVVGTQGMVASQEATATRIGLEVLKRGGNAVDAAVAVGFALAVTLPRAGNLGGGGFMLIHMAESGETLALDYREEAPAAAGRDLFLGPDGEVDNQRARFSYLSAGVPGTVAGLAAAQARFGRLTLAEILAPAIRLAEEGVTVSPFLAEGLAARADRMKAWPETARIFFKADGSPYRAGERLVQADLAWSLKEIALKGPEAFYTGEIGRRIAADMNANGGLITEADLAAYDVAWRAPVTGRYRGYEIASMPPPSSGGIHLVQILNLLESYPLAEMGAGSAATLHVMAEAMKLAYADRSQHLGDPDFWAVPQRGLTSKAYASRLRQRIDQARALAAAEIGPGDPAPYESNETTHFSVADRFGNVVSNTYTINFSYGSGIVAKGTGILLNNEMDDFSAKPGTPNAYGLIGGEANAIEPGKRPLSSMTPTLVFKDGKPWLVTGSPGGSRIITTVLQIILNTVDHGMNVAAASAAPRIHHQWLPDELRVEPGLSPDSLSLLARKGHRVVVKNAMGSTQSLLRIEGGWTGASDPRRPGALTLGY
ncbi:MAG: gamma-glutamyltransferase [Kiloniellales bacterium]|nr:gamma-glutamyltransferase [Kiloniellales bacterium]